MIRLKHLIPRAALLATLALPTAVLADFNDGVVAHAMGDYERALQTLLPLAQTSDHAYAQYFIGVMYANGQGVDRDFAAAAEWYRKAAEQGVAAAQARLGRLYEDGQGVPRDMEFAYAWYAVATKLGNGRAASLLERARGNMTAEEMAEADKLAGDYISRYGTPPADPGQQPGPIRGTP